MSERINGALPDLFVWVVVFAVLAVYRPVAVVPPVTQPGEETPDHVVEKLVSTVCTSPGRPGSAGGAMVVIWRTSLGKTALSVVERYLATPCSRT